MGDPARQRFLETAATVAADPTNAIRERRMAAGVLADERQRREPIWLTSERTDMKQAEVDTRAWRKAVADARRERIKREAVAMQKADNESLRVERFIEEELEAEERRRQDEIIQAIRDAEQRETEQMEAEEKRIRELERLKQEEKRKKWQAEEKRKQDEIDRIKREKAERKRLADEIQRQQEEEEENQRAAQEQTKRSRF